jgi:hypothetical protein
MLRGTFLKASIFASLLMLVLPVAASAATPSQIYRDWADNGRLDGRYTQSELQAALQDTTLQGYGNGNFAPTVRQQIGRQSGGASVAGVASAQRSGTLPFTGSDLALLVAGGAFLLLLGVGMVRAGRTRARAES